MRKVFMTANAKNYFRPTLETLENREMMDASIGGVAMQRMLDMTQGAQIRLLAQETSALQNQNNPLSQALTQANQAFLAQSQQLNANLQVAADRIFSAWSHQVDQVVHNIQGQTGAALASHARYGQEYDRDFFRLQFGQAVRDLFDKTIVANGWNIWLFQSVELQAVHSSDRNGKSLLAVDLSLHLHVGEDHDVTLYYDNIGTSWGGLAVFKLYEVSGYQAPFLESAIRDRMATLYHAALGNAVASQAVTPNPATTDASFAHLAQQAW
jgi:hypothetical protein